MRTKLTVKKFDLEYTQDEFFREVTRLFENAAINFIQTAIPQFPSLTGQAKAAVINVAGELGLDVNWADPMDPPLSNYMHLRPSLIGQGNEIDRGYTMGKSKIQKYKNTIAWEIKLSITAAHNGFEYFTYWDNSLWHSMDAAMASAEDYIERNTSRLLKTRLK